MSLEKTEMETADENVEICMNRDNDEDSRREEMRGGVGEDRERKRVDDIFVRVIPPKA